MVGIPGHGIHGHVVGIVGVEELAGVGFGALVDFSLLCAHQKQVVDLSVEVKGSAAAHCVYLQALETFCGAALHLQLDDVSVNQLALHERPRHDPAVG